MLGAQFMRNTGTYDAGLHRGWAHSIAGSVREALAGMRALRGGALAVSMFVVTQVVMAHGSGPGTETPKSNFLSFRYEDATGPPLTELAAVLRESRILESWTGYVGARLRGIPLSMEVRFAECGKAGSWYDGNNQRIVVCYEEAARIYAVLESVEHERDKLLVSWVGAILGQMYHELAHALIHRLALPVTGREEDATDQFSLLALLHHPHGADLVLGNADYLERMAEAEKEGGADPWQRHPSYSQRYYNSLCWIYGSDPDAYKGLVESKRLPAARAESCRLEYLRGSYAWEMLLEPFMAK
jgi:hypothetical protein